MCAHFILEERFDLLLDGGILQRVTDVFDTSLAKFAFHAICTQFVLKKHGMDISIKIGQRIIQSLKTQY